MYFDIDSLVKAQAISLGSKQVLLNKKVIIEEKTESKEVEINEEKWLEELKLFSLANINKPINMGLYTVVDKKDESSNLLIREYNHIIPMDSEVPYMRLWYLEEIKNTRKIQLKFVQDNIVYHSERELSMELSMSEGGNTLTRYTISGYQKLLGMDSTTYSVEGKIVLPKPKSK